MVKRIYTQNIDGLEEMAGINPDLIVQAHGSFKTAKCILGCETMEFSKMKDYIVNSKVPYCKKCKRPIKPEITFFGERLPERFKKFSEDDFDNVDLVLVIGTSLSVNPFRDLIINYPTPQVPRILFNTSNVELPSDIVWQMFVCGESDKICEYVANKLGIVL
jgi:NAD-dependent deacetylase sirtuin 2